MFCELRAVALAVARHVDLMPLRGLERLPRVERPAEQPRKRGGDRKPRDGAHGRAEGRAHTTRRLTHLDVQSRDDAALMLLGLVDVAQGHFLCETIRAGKKTNLNSELAHAVLGGVHQLWITHISQTEWVLLQFDQQDDALTAVMC